MTVPRRHARAVLPQSRPGTSERRERLLTHARRLGTAALALGPLIAMAPAPALASAGASTTTTVRSDQVVTGDLLLAGANVEFAGTVDGSLFVSGGTINVSGTVTHDLVVAGGTVTVPGEVRGSIRAVGGSVTLMGAVGRDVVAGGRSLELGLGAVIGRDVVLHGDRAVVGGSIGRRLVATARSLTLRGHVAGDVLAEAAALRLDDGAGIDGDLVYTSERLVSLAQGAAVGGRVQRHTPQGRATPATGAAGSAWLPALLGLFLLGMAVAAGLPRLAGRVIAAAGSCRRHAGRAVFLLAPAALPVLFAGGMLLGVWWPALLLDVAAWLAVAAGCLLSGLLVGRHVPAAEHHHGGHARPSGHLPAAMARTR
jgi:cytoskeletal protein CcmA (bactofilin family)